jgi:hypothetical protein
MIIKKKTQEVAADRLVVMSENGTADIAIVTDTDDEKIKAASSGSDYIVPLGDLKAYANSRGLIYIYPATQDNIEDAKRLAQLEKSIVLKQITQYKTQLQHVDEDKMSFTKIFPYILIVLLLIVVMVK